MTTRELERLGPEGTDYMVLGLEAPGFAELTRRQRALSYHLYRAAVAGDRIFTAQCHRHAPDIIELFETIHTHSDGLDPAVRSAVHEHLKFLWINHGQYDHENHGKFIPRTLSFEMLENAARHAANVGAFPGASGAEAVGARLARLRPHIFDRDREPIQTNQKEGADIIATSAVNLYERGITAAMFEKVSPEWKERLNVRFDLKDGEIVPNVYRIGGLYGRDLGTVAFFLGKAIPLAESPEQRASLEALARHYETGDETDYDESARHWLKSSTTVDYLNGFVEQYLDPRGVIGQFEANVSFVADSTLIGRLADSAPYFEAKMPWPDKYKRGRIARPVANVVNVIVETGDAGPCSPAAYNLPNSAEIRRDHGSKNIVLNNIEAARSRQAQETIYREFYLPEYRDLISEYFEDGRKWTVYMHEVIGHGSGQPEADLPADPRTLVGRAYSALEECRADLVALYHIFDERLVEMGAFPATRRQGIIEAAYLGCLQGHLVRYRAIPEDTVREAHRRGGELLLQYLTRGGASGDRDHGVRIVRKDADYFVALENLDRARQGVAELLSTLQTIKSRGDEKAATDLFERFGTHLDPAIRKNITARAERLRLPRVNAFVFPRLEPVVENGQVVDATIREDETLTSQQLRFSRMRFSTAIG